MLGVYIAGDSGAYLNPAITLTNCIFRQLPWRGFSMYFVVPMLGGFIGSGIVNANYLTATDWFKSGAWTVPPAGKATAALFCTYPQHFLTKTSQLFSEFIASALLMFVILALKDPTNNGVPKACTSTSPLETRANRPPKDDQWIPLRLFFLIFGLGSCFGWEIGYEINMARNFGPRPMSYAI
ncbi:aquaporin-like protein [Ampelomyces quisqualis]|uniref:Aquaporin-like protein n=1 Tax=Ampelomyces quisqualis TaxID=50730 RepID=A0A6A5QA46_AMPQU|nr:aquaporin-like protein [Ampelomyces quisqualis]